MGEIVYALCGLTSTLCAALLARAFVRSREALLFWSAFCFVGLAVTSILLFVDLVVVPERDLSALRAAISMVSMGSLAIAIAWSTRRA